MGVKDDAGGRGRHFATEAERRAYREGVMDGYSPGFHRGKAVAAQEALDEKARAEEEEKTVFTPFTLKGAIAVPGAGMFEMIIKGLGLTNYRAN